MTNELSVEVGMPVSCDHSPGSPPDVTTVTISFINSNQNTVVKIMVIS